MATVYLADDLKLHRNVALKVLRPDLTAALGPDRFLQEIEIEQPDNTLFVLVSNDEVHSTEAWKLLVGEGVLNVYLLEGGINGWLDAFAGGGACEGWRPREDDPPEGTLRCSFQAALGANRPIADPDTFRDLDLAFTPKVKMEVRTELKGGCG